MIIRQATIEDLPQIVEIYNQAIAIKFSTADTEKVSLEEKIEWFESHLNESFPIFVIASDNILHGWISISPYRPGRKALRYIVEISYYVHENYRNKGVGTTLLSCVIERCKLLEYKNIFAIILDRNTASVRLMEKFGFEKWAHLPLVADFDGEECSHVYYGLRIN